MSNGSPPSYPDGDPLTVKIDRDPPLLPGCEPFLFLDEIDPTPVMYELVDSDNDMFVMRLKGLDIVPDS